MRVQYIDLDGDILVKLNVVEVVRNQDPDDSLELLMADGTFYRLPCKRLVSISVN